MEYVNLGNTDIKVSKVCLGCMGFGNPQAGMHSWTLPYEESKKIIKHALDQGINFFDTAMGYQGGTSEEYLGRAIKEYSKREDVVIATKFMPRSQVQIDQGVSAREHIETCLNNSLKRLQMDYVDLYILHRWDNVTPIKETMEILNDLVKSKKVRAIGVSNCFAWQIARANEIAKNNGWATFQSIQGHYNLIFREEEREMKPYCDLMGVSMTPYSSLASGRLSRHPGETSYHTSNTCSCQEELAKKRNCSMSEISLAWLMSKVTSPVVGATKLSHIDTACKACDLKLTVEEMKYLEGNTLDFFIPIFKRSSSTNLK